MKTAVVAVVACCAFLACAKAGLADAPAYDPDVKSIIDTRCAGPCHHGAQAAGGVDLSGYRTGINGKNTKDSWRMVLRTIEMQRMPPPDSGTPPTDAEKHLLSDWEASDFPETVHDIGRLTFNLWPTAPALLPFSALRERLKKFLMVAGIYDAEPLLARFDQARAQLGGHDFANGILPNASTTPQKAAAWIAASGAICGDPRVAAKFSDETGFRALVLAVVGNEPDATDRAVRDGIRATVDADQQFATLCLAYLGSMEVLAL